MALRVLRDGTLSDMVAYVDTHLLDLPLLLYDPSSILLSRLLSPTYPGWVASTHDHLREHRTGVLRLVKTYGEHLRYRPIRALLPTTSNPNDLHWLVAPYPIDEVAAPPQVDYVLPPLTWEDFEAAGFTKTILANTPRVSVGLAKARTMDQVIDVLLSGLVSPPKATASENFERPSYYGRSFDPADNFFQRTARWLNPLKDLKSRVEFRANDALVEAVYDLIKNRLLRAGGEKALAAYAASDDIFFRSVYHQNHLRDAILTSVTLPTLESIPGLASYDPTTLVSINPSTNQLVALGAFIAGNLQAINAPSDWTPTSPGALEMYHSLLEQVRLQVPLYPVFEYSGFAMMYAGLVFLVFLTAVLSVATDQYTVGKLQELMISIGGWVRGALTARRGPPPQAPATPPPLLLPAPEPVASSALVLDTPPPTRLDSLLRSIALTLRDPRATVARWQRDWADFVESIEDKEEVSRATRYTAVDLRERRMLMGVEEEEERSARLALPPPAAAPPPLASPAPGPPVEPVPVPRPSAPPPVEVPVPLSRVEYGLAWVAALAQSLVPASVRSTLAPPPVPAVEVEVPEVEPPPPPPPLPAPARRPIPTPRPIVRATPTPPPRPPPSAATRFPLLEPRLRVAVIRVLEGVRGATPRPNPFHVKSDETPIYDLLWGRRSDLDYSPLPNHQALCAAFVLRVSAAYPRNTWMSHWRRLSGQELWTGLGDSAVQAGVQAFRAIMAQKMSEKKGEIRGEVAWNMRCVLGVS